MPDVFEKQEASESKEENKKRKNPVREEWRPDHAVSCRPL